MQVKDLVEQKHLSFQDIGIWFILKKYYTDQNNQVTISISKFAEEMNRSKGHISERINNLIKFGLVEVKGKKLYLTNI